jgi:hypothetical protein
VVQRVGTVAYKLDLPTSSTIQPMIHVSQLKRAISPKDQVEFTICICTPSGSRPGARHKDHHSRQFSSGTSACSLVWFW